MSDVLGIAIDKEKTLDSLEIVIHTGLSKEALIKLARKWNEHGYPSNEKEALKNLVREECAREMIADALDREGKDA